MADSRDAQVQDPLAQRSKPVWQDYDAIAWHEEYELGSVSLYSGLTSRNSYSTNFRLRIEF